MFKVIFTLCFILLASIACRAPKIPCKPCVEYLPPCQCLPHKASLFPLLTCEELKEQWAKELKIGLCFAKECDYYRAITSFKRALFLLPCHLIERHLEIEYEIILTYYLACKYEEVICTFNESKLKNCLSSSFPALEDILLILYDTYEKLEDKQCAEGLLQFLKQLNPQKASLANLYTEISQGRLCDAAYNKDAPPYLFPLYQSYLKNLKSPRTASLLNTFIPGAGYLYVGQKNTAFTAFIVNALFIAAAYQFFHRGYIAAGIFTTSLELGWYTGGIYGAARAATDWNEHQYTVFAKKALDQACIYPTLMLKFTF